MRVLGLVLVLALLGGCAATGAPSGATPRRTISPAGTGGPTGSVTGPPLIEPESPAPVPTPPSPPPGSGVTGVTVAGPTCPVDRVGGPCGDRPVPAKLTVVDARSGATVATVTTGTDGVFRIALAPGTYLIRVGTAGGALRRPEPVTVVVPTGRYVTTNVRFDTGIR
jgi:hypothetical protein